MHSALIHLPSLKNAIHHKKKDKAIYTKGLHGSSVMFPFAQTKKKRKRKKPISTKAYDMVLECITLGKKDQLLE
ncbi:hypothetical protein EK904_010017 [Melospiza melodia maxima]|nr:hypothetical protein EK904_010017 [Melospiza melodia maxima]